ncbi:zinc ribbon domain-containing protein [Ectothiorhodospiraceae bacterium BW-2]|nr:zinc ribbon domain-containing protein [Ectothiorhodospiraceae bacterium BW-2]
MPTYDYLCEANQQVYEVKHAMTEQIETWQQLCAIAAIPLAEIAPDTPVTKLISGGGIVSSGALKNPEAPACMSGGRCGGGGCGL